ncbi:hypothetical protein P5673_031634 [Acropora cervicornis]|uniref:Uncharacterized protein n=1 Tax=Acropora cervicornis TaxID=6130 RepID=A0AAD9PSF5_ACRCE|nr:hypothetical protein P5673_031634 [Acropora cervicornis]
MANLLTHVVSFAVDRAAEERKFSHSTGEEVKLLNGDDLNKQLDDLTKANKIGHKVQGPSTKPRYHPYGSSSGARDRGYRQNYLGRGRGSNYTPGARKGPFLGSGRGGPPQRRTR